MKDFQFYIFVRSLSQPSLAPGLVSTYIEEQSCAGKRVQCPAEEFLALLDPPLQITKFSGYSVNSDWKKEHDLATIICMCLFGESESRLSFFINRLRVNHRTLIIQF